MINILITGGLGYIGGRVASYLKRKEPDVYISLTTRKKNENLPNWTRQINVIQMDINDEKSIENTLKSINVDIIIHLAALNEIDSMKDPKLALEVNTYGTYKLLNLARINNVSKFIYFSTFHVYGSTSDSVITEDTATRPFHPYAITHRAAEDLVTFFSHYHDMKTLILRLSNCYGYPMDININRWTLVFNDLCRQAVTSGRIVLKSSGKQHRDFISLHDIARALYHFLFVIPNDWGDGLYNLGGNCSMSILDVAKKVSEVYKIKYGKEIIAIEKKIEGNMNNVTPFKFNIDKLRKTGFVIEGNMETEISNTMVLCEEFK